MTEPSWKSWVKRILGRAEPQSIVRFTVRSRQVLNIALQVAEGRDDRIVRVEYLLIGLLRENEGVAARTLKELGIKTEELESLIYSAVKPIPSRNKTPELSGDVNHLLELAVDEARHLQQDYVGTEHLLLGLMSQDELLPVKVLSQLGVTPEMVRVKAKMIMEQLPPAQ